MPTKACECGRTKNYYREKCVACVPMAPRRRVGVEERFWEKVSIPRDLITGCWAWSGARGSGGYGMHWIGDGVSRVAHRVAFQIVRGPIQEGLTLDHLCRNRQCVNPAHLDPCTAGENASRSPNAPYWVKARQTHCKRGHEFNDSNTYVKSGRRSCRECAALLSRLRRSAEAAP